MKQTMIDRRGGFIIVAGAMCTVDCESVTAE